MRPPCLPGRSRSRAGFALLPVALALAVVAAAAFALSRTSSGSVGRARSDEVRRQASLVAEAGLRHAIRLASEGACTGYALPPTSFGPHQYSATFSPTAGSPVTITALGTLANGITRSRVRESQPILEGLQPAVLWLPDDGDDTHLSSLLPDANYGASPVLVLSNASGEQRPILRFDLSALPPGAHVVSAELSLHYEAAISVAPGARVTAHAVEQTWLEGTGLPLADGATWETWDGNDAWQAPGGDAETAPAASAPLPASPGSRVGLDLTRVVQQWVSGARPNHGVQLRTPDAVDTLGFSSGESLTPAQRPRLIVVHGCECGGGDQSTTLELRPGPSGEDTYLDDGSPAVSWGSDVLMRISNKTNSQKRGLLRFDLSAVDPGATVGSAELELELEGIGSGDPATIFVHRALRSWQEAQATWVEAQSGSPWSLPGGDFDPAAEAQADIDPLTLGPTVFDVTALVSDWVSDGSSNHGLFLLGSPDVNHADFSSSDANATSRRPKLTVIYACGCGPCAPPPEYLDTFAQGTCDAAIDFAGSDGTLDWSPTPWQRVGETSGGSCSGGASIESTYGEYELRFSADGIGLERAVDLSMFTTPGLELSFVRVGLEDASQALLFEASTDGLGWTEIGRIAGPGSDPGYQQTSFDLTPFATATARIRLLGQGLGTQGGTDRYVYVDDVRIADLPPPPPAPDQVTLAPDADTFLKETDADASFGTASSIETGVDAGWKRYRTLVRFDLAPIPPGATVTSAVLRMYVHNFFGNQGALVSLFQATDAWDESSTWNSTGGSPFDPATPLGGTFLDWSTTGWAEWSVPPGLVHEWLDAVSPNHGLLLEYEGTKKNHRMAIRSREHGDTALHPQLVVSYQLP